MIKSDEKKFTSEVVRIKPVGDSSVIFQIINKIGMHEKRASYILEKMTNKGQWNYGVSLFSGWLTNGK